MVCIHNSSLAAEGNLTTMNKIKSDMQSTCAQPSKERDAENRESRSSSIESNDPEDTKGHDSECPQSGNLETVVESLVPHLNHTSRGESKHEVTHSEADGGEQPCQEKASSCKLARLMKSE